MSLLKEFCAENTTLVPDAIAAGAARIELCDNLAVGGTSPSIGVIRSAVAYAKERDVAIMAMARPRGGDFAYSEAELAIMLDDIAWARSSGVTGVVFGCTRAAGPEKNVLDEEFTKQLVEAAKGAGSGPARDMAAVQVTFHMAFDVLDADEQLKAIDTLASLGVERILTHGGPAQLPIEDNLEHLRELIAYANGRLTILPGGGINWKNAESVAASLGVSEVHGTKIVQL